MSHPYIVMCINVSGNQAMIIPFAYLIIKEPVLKGKAFHMRYKT